MKTHADIVSILRAEENTLKTEFGMSELGLVSTNVEYRPVANVRLFVDGMEPAGFERLESYLATELGLTVEVIARATANGTFRYAFTRPRP